MIDTFTLGPFHFPLSVGSLYAWAWVHLWFIYWCCGLYWWCRLMRTWLAHVFLNAVFCAGTLRGPADVHWSSSCPTASMETAALALFSQKISKRSWASPISGVWSVSAEMKCYNIWPVIKHLPPKEAKSSESLIKFPYLFFSPWPFLFILPLFIIFRQQKSNSSVLDWGLQ